MIAALPARSRRRSTGVGAPGWSMPSPPSPPGWATAPLHGWMWIPSGWPTIAAAPVSSPSRSPGVPASPVGRWGSKPWPSCQPSATGPTGPSTAPRPPRPGAAWASGWQSSPRAASAPCARRRPPGWPQPSPPSGWARSPAWPGSRPPGRFEWKVPHTPLLVSARLEGATADHRRATDLGLIRLLDGPLDVAVERAEAGWLAVLHATRFGVEPTRVIVCDLRQGRRRTHRVTPALLDGGVAAIITAATVAVGRSLGDAINLTPGRHCGYCARRAVCPQAALDLPV
jgi:hypothetical protein